MPSTRLPARVTDSTCRAAPPGVLPSVRRILRHANRMHCDESLHRSTAAPSRTPRGRRYPARAMRRLRKESCETRSLIAPFGWETVLLARFPSSSADVSATCHGVVDLYRRVPHPDVFVSICIERLKGY